MIQHKGIVILLAAGSLLAAPVAIRPTADSRANAYAANLGSGELVGKVVNSSNRALKRRVQVRAGGREWTLHVPNGAAVVHAKREVSIHDLELGTYVRAIGQRIGTTRLKASRVYVIGDRLALRTSGYARRAGEGGYFVQHAGYRSRYRR
jgi:hypothetical protein